MTTNPGRVLRSRASGLAALAEHFAQFERPSSAARSSASSPASPLQRLDVGVFAGSALLFAAIDTLMGGDRCPVARRGRRPHYRHDQRVPRRAGSRVEPGATHWLAFNQLFLLAAITATAF